LGTGNLAWHPNNQWMAGVTQFSLIDIWDVQSGNRLNRIHAGSGFVLDLDWNPDGRLASSNRVGEVFTWDIEKGEIVKGFYIYRRDDVLSPAADTIAWSPDGKKIVVGASDNTFRFWDTMIDVNPSISQDTDPSVLQARINDRLFKEREGSVLDIVWSPDGRYVYGSDQSGYIRIFDTMSNTLVDSIEVDKSKQIFTISLSPYGGRLAFGANPVVTPNSQRSVLNKSIDGGKVQIIVPIPSFDTVKSISAQCLTKSTEALPSNNALATESVSVLTKADLPDFITQVKALPEGAIPPACAADLIAVAEAIIAQP
jgi:WD40 repeat protein